MENQGEHLNRLPVDSGTLASVLEMGFSEQRAKQAIKAKTSVFGGAE